MLNASDIFRLIKNLYLCLSSLVFRTTFYSYVENKASHFTKIRVQHIGNSFKDCEQLNFYGFRCRLPESSKPVLLTHKLNNDSNSYVCIPLAQKNNLLDMEEGTVEIFNPSNTCRILLRSDGSIDIKASKLTIDSTSISLGTGGKKIARVGDRVEVDTSTGIGEIKEGGVNTSL